MPMMTIMSSHVGSIMRSSHQKIVVSSRVPDCDIGEYIGNILTIIRRCLKMLVDILEFDDGDGVRGLEEIGDCMGKHVIGKIFQAVYFNASLFTYRGSLSERIPLTALS